MNCGKIQNLLSAYMDGELTGEEQLQIRRHLHSCRTCSAEHDSLLTTKRMISGLTVREGRPDLEQMILQMLADEEQNRARRSPILAWWLTLPQNRRMQFASAFAIGAVALASYRIVPVLLSPPRSQPFSSNFARVDPTVRRPSPVGDLLYIHNPAENAPMGGGGAVPISVKEYSDISPR